jgi:hypothetical protein
MVASVLAGRHWFPLRDEAQPEPPKPPAPTRECRDGCKCAIKDCKCGARGLPCNALSIDESKVAIVQAQAAYETPHIVGFAPKWCVACKFHRDRLGDGDQLTRIEWRETEAHFTPESYPVLYDPTRLKQLAGQNIPATMDGVRVAFGIKPVARGHVAALPIGTIAREYVTQFRRVAGKRGSFELGNDAVSELYGGFTVEAPANFTAKWTLKDGALRVEFPKRPKIRYGVLYQDMQAIAIGDDKVTLELPWAPDAVLTIK